MKGFERLSALGVLVFTVGALALFSTPSAPFSTTVAQAQTTNATTAEAPPEGEAATTEEHEHASNETGTEGTTTVRDSVFALLADQTIPASGFIHLYDTTPYSIKNGHVAAKIPCEEDSTPALNVLVGAAPQFTPAPLELIANLSSPGELCLYHVDLPAPEQANATSTNATTPEITDIALQNPGDEDVTLPSTSTVVIGINEIARGAAHTHEEGGGEEQASQAVAATTEEE